MSFFKAYDMRGEFGVDFTLDTVYRIGRWLPTVIGAHRFLVGRDARISGGPIHDTLCQALVESGAEVDDMGLASTPMVYFMTASGAYDCSVQITASHNPPSHNGMKVSRHGAMPVGYESGLAELERRAASGELPPPAEGGQMRQVQYREDFVRWLVNWGLDFRHLRFAVDCSDGMAALFAHEVFGPSAVYLNDQVDGSFPHHSPNPLDPDSRRQLVAAVREQGLDLGMVFDGDADRVMFVDERGEFISPDCLIPIIARHFLKNEPGAAVIHDVRTSRGAIEALIRDGARPVMGKVGHAYAKILLRQEKAVCGGELAGHYYFRDFYCCDSAGLAAMIVLAAVDAAKAEGKTFSQLLAPILCYAGSGEINFRLSGDAHGPVGDAAIAALLKAAEAFGEPTGRSDIDGVRLEFRDGWINVRRSNTEPYLRLLAEAADAAVLTERVAILREAIKPYLKK